MKVLKSPLFLRTLVFLLGVFFVVSAVGKILNVEAFDKLLYNYGFGAFFRHPWFKYLVPVIPVLEFVLGFAMLLQLRPKLLSALSFFFLIVFTAAFANAYFLNEVTDCGCFGEFTWLKSSPLISFLRNGLLMLLALWCWLYLPSKSKENFVGLRYTLLLVCSAFAFTLSGSSWHKPLYTPYASDYSLVNETTLRNHLPLAKDSTYLVFIFGYGCPHCWNQVQNVEHYAQLKAVDKVYGLGYDANGLQKEEFYKFFNPSFEIKDIDVNSLLQLTDRTPTTFFIKNDTIVWATNEEVISPANFLRYKF